MDYEAKKKLLYEKCNILSKNAVALALSGGVDSGLLLHLLATECKKNNTKFVAYSCNSNLILKSDMSFATNLAKTYMFAHYILDLDILSVPEIINNPKNRCYLCKKYMFEQIKSAANSQGIKIVVDGSNLDDTKEYRPGMQAKQELGIVSPLLECEFTKADVRMLAKELNLELYCRPSTPCLATRLPYGAHLDFEILNRIEQAETILKQKCQVLSKHNLRVRVHDDIARIEVDKQCFEEVVKNATLIEETIKKLGFKYVTLDLCGFTSGSFDK